MLIDDEISHVTNRFKLARSVIWANLTPNEAWAFLSGVAQRLICPSRIGNRLCFVCHSAFLRLRKRRFHFNLRPAAKNTGKYPRERPARCSNKLGRFYKSSEISNGPTVPAAQRPRASLMRQRNRFARGVALFAARRICAAVRRYASVMVR
jgi:hypothetical protein